LQESRPDPHLLSAQMSQEQTCPLGDGLMREEGSGLKYEIFSFLGLSDLLGLFRSLSLLRYGADWFDSILTFGLTLLPRY